MNTVLHCLDLTFAVAVETTLQEWLRLAQTYLHEYASIEHLHYEVTPVEVKALQDHELEVEEDV